MINIAELDDDDVGREVVYRDFGASKREFGKVTSWNEKFIFVRYHTISYDNGKITPRVGETSEATAPSDLDFTFPKDYPREKTREKRLTEPTGQTASSEPNSLLDPQK